MNDELENYKFVYIVMSMTLDYKIKIGKVFNNLEAAQKEVSFLVSARSDIFYCISVKSLNKE